MATRKKKGFDIESGIKRLVPAVAGGVAAGYVNKISNENLQQLDPKIRAFIPALVGTYLGVTQSGQMSDLGLGMVGASGPAILAALGMENIVSGAEMDVARRIDPDTLFTEEEVDDFEAQVVRNDGMDGYMDDSESYEYDDEDEDEDDF